MRPQHLFDLNVLLKCQWKTPEIIKGIQERKLKKLIEHAYHKVPYYRELFDSLKLKPEDIKKIDDLRQIPLTSRKQFQDLRLEEKMARGIDPERCVPSVTSGSTGIPLEMYFTPSDKTLMNLSWARAFLSSGMKPWYKMISFTGEQDEKNKKSWYEYLGLWRNKEITVWKKPEEWIKEIQEWKPQVLVGYVMTLKILGEVIQENQIQGILPKLIVHSSAVLDPFSWKFLDSVFHAKIADVYGSDEGGCIAWECDRCSGYHIYSDMVIVEILKNGEPVPPGEDGEVIITNLHSYAMPFIRYTQDDIATLSKKRPLCGRGFPLLEQIQGRKDDFIVLKNGQKMGSHPFYRSISFIPGIKRWRITQEDIDNLKVEIEPAANFSLEIQKVLEKKLKTLVRNQININIFIIDSIPISPSVKFRAVSSKIKAF